MKILSHEALVRLNESSFRAGRLQNLRPERLQGNPRERYHITCFSVHEQAGLQDIRMCVVLDSKGLTAWLDVSLEEFAAIPEIEVSIEEWEVALCAGTPPRAP